MGSKEFVTCSDGSVSQAVSSGIGAQCPYCDSVDPFCFRGGGWGNDADLIIIIVVITTTKRHAMLVVAHDPINMMMRCS